MGESLQLPAVGVDEWWENRVVSRGVGGRAFAAAWCTLVLTNVRVLEKRAGRPVREPPVFGRLARRPVGGLHVYGKT
jgi:hypothetical protein